MTISLILVCGIVLSSIFSALFSGAETGMYQLSRLRLRLRVEKKQFFCVTLSKTLKDAPALLLTILLGNNLANYFATSLTTYLLMSTLQNDHYVELCTAILITPTLFVFSELIPKNLFFYRADSLMPCISPILFLFHKFFKWSGLVPLLKLFSRIAERSVIRQMPTKALLTVAHQPHINTIFHESHEEGLLSTTQANIIKRMAGFTQLTVKSVMTPLNKIQAIGKNAGKSDLLKILEKSSFTRFPVAEGPVANVVGFVDIYEPLLCDQSFDSLDNFIKPIRDIPAETTVSDAINIMQSENLKIMLVKKTSYGSVTKPLGIITMKDLVEELIGELTEW